MMADGVVLTIDGREVEVAPGTGLVEAAAQLDIEVPVFCYEPRIGPAVGACRMCLVEIEGMPKLQTACSTTVRPGMVVSTAGHRAREAQEAVLEFLLINHPLDCPVCDKGGECPLQDQTFRWGPGASRFLELKRNSDKPIPISPLIALDRERCILCYRCTRFSAEVAQDGQLISRERGANTIIATFEGRPYEGHFSGNVIELCPVGALTSTEYRFKGRPWEVVDHPTVCGLCPVGCNTYNTVREGEVHRVLARQNDAVDEGWLCDRGRFSYPALSSVERIVMPVIRRAADAAGPRPATLEGPTTLSHEGAMDWLHRHVAHREHTRWGGREMAATWVLSGDETCEEAYLVRAIAQATGGRVVAVEGGSAALPEPAASLADVERAGRILVIGDAELADVAPIVDLRVRKAIRGGAQVFAAGIGGTKLETAGATHLPVAPGAVGNFVEGLLAGTQELAAVGEALRADAPTVVIVEDGLVTGEQLEQLAAAFGLAHAGSGVLGIPGSANARGLAAVGIEPAGRALLDRPGGLVFYNVDPAKSWDDETWRTAVAGASWTAAISAFPNELTAVADLVVPATMPHEKDGTLVNLEGRLQRLTATVTPPGEARPEIGWLSALARRVGVVASSSAAGVYAAMQRDDLPGSFPAATYREISRDGELGVRGGALPLPVEGAQAAARGNELSLYVAPFLYDAPEVAHSPRMQFLRDTTVVRLSRADAARLGIARGDALRVIVGEVEFTAQAALSARISEGHARVPAGAPGVPSHLVGHRAAVIEKVSLAQGARA